MIFKDWKKEWMGAFLGLIISAVLYYYLANINNISLFTFIFIIAVPVFLILFFILFIFVSIPTMIISLFSTSSNNLERKLDIFGESIFHNINNSNHSLFIISFIVTGILIGFIIGKIKSKK